MNCAESRNCCIHVYAKPRTKGTRCVFILFAEKFCKEIATDRRKFCSSYYLHWFLWFSNPGKLDVLFLWDEIGKHFDMYYNEHNFDGHKQMQGRSFFFRPEDIAQWSTPVLSKAVAQRFSVKKVFLKILQNSQENTGLKIQACNFI